MHISNHLFRAGLGLDMVCWILGGCRCDSGFVVETIEVAACFLEIFYPFLRLRQPPWVSRVFFNLDRDIGKGHTLTYLGDHHMAVECALSLSHFGALDVGPDLGHHRRSEGHVGYEVAVHLDHRSQLLW